MKLFWSYLCDMCDSAGIWEVNFRLAEFQIGTPLPREDVLETLGNRVEKIADNKWLLVGFIPFQYPNLSLDCKPHKPVFNSLGKHNLIERYSKGNKSLLDKDKDKEKDKEKEGGVGGEPTALVGDSFTILDFLNEKTGKSFQRVPGNLKFIASRLKENVTVEDCKKVIELKVRDWLHDPKMKEYLRPQTLFNSEKFPAYLASATARPLIDKNAVNGF